MKKLGELLAGLRRPSGRHHRDSIGLDLALEECNMVQLKPVSGGMAVSACCSLPYPAGREALIASSDGFRRFIDQALRQYGFHGRRVVSCLPPDQVRIFPVSYDLPVADEELVIAEKALAKVGGRPDEYFIDYLKIRPQNRESSERTALAVLAHQDEVMRYLDLLDAAALEVAALDIGPAALRRLIVATDTREEYPSVLLVNFGRQKSYVTFLSGRRLMFDRAIDMGEAACVDRLADELDMQQEQVRQLLLESGFVRGATGSDSAMRDADPSRVICEVLKPLFLECCEEINKLLLYTAAQTRGETVAKVYLVGSVARYPGIEQYMGAMLALPAVVLHPLAHLHPLSAGTIPVGVDPVVALALATGLALRGNDDHG